MYQPNSSMQWRSWLWIWLRWA